MNRLRIIVVALAGFAASAAVGVPAGTAGQCLGDPDAGSSSGWTIMDPAVSWDDGPMEEKDCGGPGATAAPAGAGAAATADPASATAASSGTAAASRAGTTAAAGSGTASSAGSCSAVGASRPVSGRLLLRGRDERVAGLERVEVPVESDRGHRADEGVL